MAGASAFISMSARNTRDPSAPGQDEQHRVTIRPAIGKRRLKRSIRIKPGQILVTELEDIGVTHHPAKARHIGVAVADHRARTFGSSDVMIPRP